jgi:cytochrome c2
MRYILVIGVLIALVALAGVPYALRTQRWEKETRAQDLTGGNIARGQQAARELGCVACHIMPGIRGPRSRVGPPLEDFALRHFVAGAADNTPQNVQQFIRDPRSIAPRSAMPKLDVSEAQARDLAAYLFSQR